MILTKVIERFRVSERKSFHLNDHRPDDTAGLDIRKKEARDVLAETTGRLADLQQRLYAQNQWAILIIFQAMDAAGKDSAIRHVMSGINPQGCQVFSFKQPSTEELDHDFMWRTTKRLPERGRIGIFNRSYYEEVLVVRVHPKILAGQQIPPSLVTKNIWKERFEDIRHFERYIARNGIVPIKFFLNLSKDEQKKRFLSRLDEPEKNWKFSMSDVAERKLWPRYMAAYQEMIRATAAPHAPWYVIPADNKWFARLAVASVIADTMEKLDLRFPEVTDAAREGMRAARAALLAEDGTPSEESGGGKDKKGTGKKEKAQR